MQGLISNEKSTIEKYDTKAYIERGGKGGRGEGKREGRGGREGGKREGGEREER